MTRGDITGNSVPEILANMYAEADALAAEVGWPSANLRTEFHRHVTMLFTQGYVQNFSTREEAPDFVPHTGTLFPWGAPNHDTLYVFAPIDAGGTYRVSGTRGSETLSSLMLRRLGANTGDVHGRPLGEFDVDKMDIVEGDRFSVLISAEKPVDYAGAWFAMPPETTGLVTRHVTSLAEQQDGTWAIERLDRNPAPVRLSDDDTLLSMRRAASFAVKLIHFLITHVKRMRDDGLHRLTATGYPEHGGLAKQLYFQGAWELAPDEALILESELPEECLYWSVQILDAFFGGIDPVAHLSSLNGDQVRPDADGKVRLVIAPEDPGVPNWLETGGWEAGGMIWRWHSASSYPEPTLTKVKLAEIRSALPGDTPSFSREERRRARGERITHYQSRRRW